MFHGRLREALEVVEDGGRGEKTIFGFLKLPNSI